MYYYDNKDFFPKSVAAFSGTEPISPPPHIFIVNQHILAAYLMARQFALSANPKVKTVVLITQNNWNAGNAPIIISRMGWKTPMGDIGSASPLIEKLVGDRVASVEEGIFATEHGITGIVPYVASSFPNANIATIVIRDGTSDELVDALAKELSGLDLSTTAIIGTIDMSHYLPKNIADAHDRLTIQSIKEFDYQTMPRLDIDTVPTLRTVMKTAESFGQQMFIQTGSANSADIVNDPGLTLTTSYITGYFAPGIAGSSGSIENAGNVGSPTGTSSVLFVGDIMLDRGVAQHADKYGTDSLFSKVERLFLGTHAVIGNFEGTMTTYPSISEKDYSILRFTADPLYAGVIKRLDFSAFSLANNHALDFGEPGYDQTVRNLSDAGLASFGSPRNDRNLSTSLDIHGKNICLVGYHDLYIPDPTPAIEEITRIRPDCTYIVLFAHWGIEYNQAQNDRQIMLAHKFIDSGVDLVIGSHPHVVEPVEIYKNKAIFYSLGNFIFDQGLSFATEHGLAVNVEFGDSMTRFTLVPTALDHAEAGIADPADGAKILSLVANRNSLSGIIASDILKTSGFTLYSH
jgi:poly-gamma-glutamate synthesis protein (capsule biosynthesis protein)